MPKTSRPVSAERIAMMADRGRDVDAHFTNRFTVVRPRRAAGERGFTAPMLEEPGREP